MQQDLKVWKKNVKVITNTPTKKKKTNFYFIFTGSWFIQDLCDIIRNFTPIEISKMTKAVIRKVNERKEDLGNGFYYVQVPNFKDCIMEDDYFLPKYHEI